MAGKPTKYSVQETENRNSETNSVDLEKSKENFYLSSILGLVKFLAVNRDRPGVFVATYLLLAGWRESR